MKVVVQIPCLNEEKTLPLVLNTIPKKIEGVDSIEVLIIDDGSHDKTIEVAKRLGVKHFVYHTRNRGLARSFQDGLNYALAIGADIIVNTDGDNQYPQERIADLVRPILEHRADIVIADRQTSNITHFSPTKKLLQRFGTKVLNTAAGTRIPDAPSGFRAYSRKAATRLNVVTSFSYAMETIIQASHKQMTVVSIPVVTNPKTRESRLFKSSWEHIRKSGMAITRATAMYKPYAIFIFLGIVLFVLGLIPFLHFLYLYFFTKNSGGAHHLQGLIIGSVLMVSSFISFTLGVVADLIRINRIVIEDTTEKIKVHRLRV